MQWRLNIRKMLPESLLCIKKDRRDAFEKILDKTYSNEINFKNLLYWITYSILMSSNILVSEVNIRAIKAFKTFWLQLLNELVFVIPIIHITKSN